MKASRTLLLVEDESLVRDYLAGMLIKNGWTVTPVGTGDEALARLAVSTFDAVLCDLDLGRGFSGIDVLSRLPAMNRAVPFVVLTAHGSAGRCREAFLHGAADFLEKPVAHGSLLSALDRAVANSVESVDEAPPLPSSQTGLPYDEDGARHVRHAIQIMERRHTDFHLGVRDVALEAGISPEYLARLFQARLGHSPLVHLHEIRISRAENLLAHSVLSIYEIGYECGYERTSKFSAWYRRLRGTVPSSLRRVDR